MRIQIILAVIFACLSIVAESKTVFRRTDKISENFKQLDLPAEEIDPNVAPPEPQKVETLDPEDVIAAPAVVEEANGTANEIIDESANEIIDSTSPVPHEPEVEPVAGNAASAAPAASSSAAAAAPAATTAEITTPAAATTTTAQSSALSKYCKCSESHCDCCRNFGLPLIPVRGPGCARISYLGKDEMSVSIKYGDITLASRRISSKKARPICVGLPGGYSKFCGRVYGLSRAKENFKACLAFELRAEDEVEAALRVSCFKFGPEGLRVAEAEPLPAVANKDPDEDDDDDDIFGFAAGGDDDEDEDADDYDDGDDDADTEDDDTETDADDYEDDDDAEPAEDADYGGFSIGGLLDELDDDDDDSKPASTSSTVAAAAAVDQSRDVTPATISDLPQSKDEAGTIAAAAAPSTANAESPATNVASVVQGIESTVTPVPAITAAASSSPDQQTNKDKPKKSKKAKKNKKKKAASATTESDFAFELLNGILDFFN